MREIRVRLHLYVLPFFVSLVALLASAGTPAQTLLWTYHSDAPILFAPTVGTDGTAYLALNNGHIEALSVSKAALWDVNVGSTPSSAMVLSNGRLYFTDTQGQLLAYTTGGAPVWEVDLQGSIQSAPAVAGDGTIYVVSTSGRLSAVSPSGQILWVLNLAETVAGCPAVTHGGNVIVAGDQDLYEVYANGEQAWYLPLDAAADGPLALDAEDNVYLVDADGNVLSVSSNGRLNWKTSLTAAVASPVVSGDAVYVTTSDQNLYRLSLSLGTQDWTFPKGGDGTPALAEGGLIFVESADNKILYVRHTSDNSAAGQSEVLPDAPGDLVLVQTTKGPRLYMICGSTYLCCLSTDAPPESAAPWNQLGAGPRHLFRRDDPPSIALTAPVDGASVSGTVTVTAQASDDFSQNLQVRFYSGETLLATLKASPYQTDWATGALTDGTYTLTAQAKDSAGQITTSSVSVTVDNGGEPTTIYADTPPPVFSWSPGNEERFRVEFSADQTFDSLLASSKSHAHPWLKGSDWQPSKGRWKKVLVAASGATDADTPVYWRVVGKSGGQIASGAFTIARPVGARLLSPADGSGTTAGEPLTFQWEPSHNDRFMVEFAATEDFSGGAVVTSSKQIKKWTKEVAWTPGAKKWKKILAIGTTVYWRVRARDAIGRETTSSSAYSFVITP